MAKDNRLDQIREGAGLEDSRINQEFVEFIRKWSTPALVVMAVLAVGYFLWNKQKEARAARIDEAFEQLSLSTDSVSPSPDALRRIAQDYQNVEGVSLLAKLAAADEYLRAVRRGVKPGALLDAEGAAQNAEDVLSDEDRQRFLSEAETLYRDVHEAASERPVLALHTLSALYGLAAVSESRGDMDAARNVLDQAYNLSIKHGFAEHAALAKQRIDSLPRLATPVTLYHKADLPEIPALKPPEPAPLPEAAPEDATLGPALPEGEEIGPGEDGADEPPGDADADGGGESAGGGAGEASDDGGR